MKLFVEMQFFSKSASRKGVPLKMHPFLPVLRW